MSMRRALATMASASPKITVHYIPIPATRVERVVWLLEELQLKYDVKAHPMVGPMSPGMKEVSKLGKTPVIDIDGRIISETGYIVHYLLGRFPQPGLEAAPSDASFFWAAFSEGTMMLHLQPGRLLGVAQTVLPKKPGTTAEQGQGIETLGNWLRNGWVKKNVTLQLAEVEDFLAAHPNFSGTEQLGEGDFMMGYVLNSIVYSPQFFGEYEIGPKTKAWVDRMRARPAHQRAMARIADEDRRAAAGVAGAADSAPTKAAAVP